MAKNIDISEKGINWGLDLGTSRASRDHMGGRSEVYICINKSGLTAHGQPRYSLVFRFSPEAVKKIAPRSSYANAGRVNDMHRIYFREDRAGTGKKLTASSRKNVNKEMRFTLDASKKKVYDVAIGSYLLLYDNAMNLYYIDWEQKLVDDFEI